MIDLYTWPTSNGHKVHILLEENNRTTAHNDDQWEIMFGSIQYQRR